MMTKSKISEIKIGEYFECNGIIYKKTPHNRGMYLVNKEPRYKRFYKHEIVNDLTDYREE